MQGNVTIAYMNSVVRCVFYIFIIILFIIGGVNEPVV